MRRFFTFAAILSLAAGCNALTAQESDVATAPQVGAGDVYFMGVDHAPAGTQGAHLASLYAAEGGDRWALTDVARRVSRDYGGRGIGLEAPIDRWNPANDPYNFGVITLRGAFHRTLTWPGLASRTAVTVDLGWLQIGHETRTRMQTGKLPELRASVSAYRIHEYTSPSPPDPPTLERLYRETFEEALRVLLQRARSAQERDLRRSAADIRYLQVTPPGLLAHVESTLASFDATEGVAAATQVRESLNGHIEHRLLELLAQHRDLDAFVLLPGERVLQYLETEWGVFAERVAALSAYNASREALGFRPPRLLRVVPLCLAPGEDQVHAVELRVTAPNLRVLHQRLDDYLDHAWISVLLAADTRLALTDTLDERMPDGAALASGRYDTQPVEKPRRFGAGEFLGLYNVQRAADAAAARLIETLAPRLQELLTLPPLSHPSHQQRFCP
jgi:hypothetical protein